jgi:hypothetical protein
MTSTDNRRMRSAEEGAGRAIGIFSLVMDDALLTNRRN